MSYGLSYHDAVATLRATDLDRLQPLLHAFVEEERARLLDRPDGPAVHDARAALEARLRAVGAPWFAFTSYVLPGWSWGSVPISRDKKTAAHVAWIRMRLDDFAREIERLSAVYFETDPLLAPGPWVRRVCRAELPRLLEPQEHAFEAYDAIHQACGLMLEASRLPVDQATRSVVAGFVGSSLPSPAILERFIDDLAGAVGTAFADTWGMIPVEGRKRDIVRLHRDLTHATWLSGWLESRLERGALLDAEAERKARDDLEKTREQVALVRHDLDDLLQAHLADLEDEINRLEEDWIGADDRDSVTTGDRLDRELALKKLEAACLHERWDEVAG